MIKGFAYLAWQAENHPFAQVKSVGPRYIAQETERLLKANEEGRM